MYRIFEASVNNKLLHKSLCHCIDDEVDGPTLLGLTEAMIARLLPTMKLQVHFQQMLVSMKTQHSEETSSSTVTEVHSDTASATSR